MTTHTQGLRRVLRVEGREGQGGGFWRQGRGDQGRDWLNLQVREREREEEREGGRET